MQTRKKTAFLIAAVMLLGLGMRLCHYLRDPSMWHDEAALVVNVIGKNFAELLGPLYFAEAAPPLFLWLERVIVLTLGDGTYALRLLPFLAGCAALVLLLPLARRALQPQAVLWALLLFAGSDRLLWHTCEAKPYTLDALAAVAVPLLFCITTHWRLGRRLALFALLAPWVIFLIYPGCFIYGGLLLALLPAVFRASVFSSASPRRFHWTPWLGYGALSAIVFASFALLLFGPIRLQRCEAMDQCWVDSFPPLNRPWAVPGWVLWAIMEVVDYCCRPGGGLAVLAGVGVWSLWRRERREIVLLLVSPILLALLASFMQAYPFGGARVMIFAAPAVVLLVAEGAVATVLWVRAVFAHRPFAPTARYATQTVLAGLMLLPMGQSLYRTAIPWKRADTAGASAYVLSHRQAGDCIFGTSWEYSYYFRNVKEAVSAEKCQLANAGRLWVIVTGKIPAEERSRLAQSLATAGRRIIQRREFADTTVVLFGSAINGADIPACP